jgi:hypothetical protein
LARRTGPEWAKQKKNKYNLFHNLLNLELLNNQDRLNPGLSPFFGFDLKLKISKNFLYWTKVNEIINNSK